MGDIFPTGQVENMESPDEDEGLLDFILRMKDEAKRQQDAQIAEVNKHAEALRNEVETAKKKGQRIMDAYMRKQKQKGADFDGARTINTEKVITENNLPGAEGETPIDPIPISPDLIPEDIGQPITEVEGRLSQRLIDLETKIDDVERNQPSFGLGLGDTDTQPTTWDENLESGGGANDEFMFYVETTNGASESLDSFTVKYGEWRRCGYVHTSEVDGGVDYKSYDPIALGWIAGDYTGPLYVYEVIRDSSGYDGFGGGRELRIGATIAGKVEEDEYFGHYLHIATLTYDTGEITGLVQHHIGQYSDVSPSLVYSNREFGIKSILDLPTAPPGYSINIATGQFRRREIELTVGGFVALSPTAGTKFWIELEASSQDPSLVPESATIKSGAVWPTHNTYDDYFRPIYAISATANVADVAVTGKVQTLCWSLGVYHAGGRMDSDWNRPDSKDEGSQPTPQKQFTIGFIPSGPHKGELEDRNFFIEVTENGGNFESTNDVLKFWAGVSDPGVEPAYVATDVSGLNFGQSIEISSQSYNILQLYNFWDGGPSSIDFSELESLSGSVDLIVRDRTGRKTVDYRQLADDFTVPQCDAPSTNWNCADFYSQCPPEEGIQDCNTLYTNCPPPLPDCATFYTACPPGSYIDWDDVPCPDPAFWSRCPHPHQNHTFVSDDHTTAGVDRYILASGPAIRNNMSGIIGDGSGGDSVGPSTRYLYDGTGTTTVDWGTRVLGGGDWSVAGNLLSYSGVENLGSVAFPWASLYIASGGFAQVGTNQGKGVADWFDGGIFYGSDVTEQSIRVIPAGGGAPVEYKVLTRPI